jgi:hypothetical protein
VIVSNFDELRLYHVRTGPQRFQRTVLSDMIAPVDVLRTLVLFSRTTLLGRPGTASALQRLLSGVLPVILPAKQGVVRMIQEARPLRSTMAELPLHAMEDALRKAYEARKRRWPWFAKEWSPELVDGDRLVVTTERGQFQRIEFTTNGTLMVSEYVPYDPQGAASATVDPVDVACRVASFLEFVNIAVASVMQGNIEVQWELRETMDAQCVSSQKGWFEPGVLTSARCKVGSTRMPPTQLDIGDLLGTTTKVLRELFYPFEAKVLGSGAIRRLSPSAEQVRLGLGTCAAA